MDEQPYVLNGQKISVRIKSIITLIFLRHLIHLKDNDIDHINVLTPSQFILGDVSYSIHEESTSIATNTKNQ